jgi:hypothetical protein
VILKEIIPVYSENHMNSTDTLLRRNANIYGRLHSALLPSRSWNRWTMSVKHCSTARRTFLLPVFEGTLIFIRKYVFLRSSRHRLVQIITRIAPSAAVSPTDSEDPRQNHDIMSEHTGGPEFFPGTVERPAELTGIPAALYTCVQYAILGSNLSLVTGCPGELFWWFSSESL